MEYIEVLVAPNNPNLDIVFVHGLNPKGQENHARTPWTHSGDATFWPQTLLPESIPTARILLFAYNSSILANASNAPVHGHANTLLSSVNRLIYLLDLLKVWLKTAQADQSQILIVLDDPGGLETSELHKVSEMISGSPIEFIYSTSDPMIADQTSYMYAVNFDVPPRELTDAQHLFELLRNPHPALAHLDLSDVVPICKIRNRYRDLSRVLVTYLQRSSAQPITSKSG